MTKEHLADGKAQAVICNSGNANTCAPNGMEIAEKTCEITGGALGLSAEDIIVCSTGVIGQELSIKPFESGVPQLAQSISYDGGPGSGRGYHDDGYDPEIHRCGI